MVESRDFIEKTQYKWEKIPDHIAVIMDGNGRWAKKHNLPRYAGHQAGLKAVKLIITEVIKTGVNILTLYAFSTENWKRSKQEINFLMKLFQDSLEKEKSSLIKNKIRVRFIGHRDSLPDSLRSAMEKLEEATKANNRLLLNIAINYSGRSEIIHVVQTICRKIKNKEINISEINEESITRYFFAGNIPDPDLLIRTGGEKRISNFLLWQIAYTELWFTKTFWPDFSKEDLWKAFDNYEKRVRKYGGEV